MITLARTLLLFACLLPSLHVKAEPSLQPHYKIATEADDVVTRVLFDAVSTEFGVSVEYINYASFDAILDAVANEDADFAANITIPILAPSVSAIPDQQTLNTHTYMG